MHISLHSFPAFPIDTHLKVEEHGNAVFPCGTDNSSHPTTWKKIEKQNLEVQKTIVENNVKVANDDRITFNIHDHSMIIKDVNITDEGYYMAEHKEHTLILKKRCFLQLTTYGR